MRFFFRPSSSMRITSENALRYTMAAMMTSVMYSLYAVRLVSCRPAMSSTDMKMAVKMTAMGLLTASRATGMPLKPSAGSVWYVLQKNSVLPDR